MGTLSRQRSSAFRPDFEGGVVEMKFREYSRGVVEGVFRPDFEGGVVDEVP